MYPGKLRGTEKILPLLILMVNYRSLAANNCSPRTSSRLANISSRRTIVHSIQNTLFGELQFAMGERSSRRTSFAANHVRGEPRSRRTLVRGGWDFFRRTNFLANCSPVRGGVRANSGEPERTPPNSGERSAYSGERSAEFAGVWVSANCWRIRAEFARVRSSSPEFAANDSSPGI